jgi:hypothetical protein
LELLFDIMQLTKVSCEKPCHKVARGFTIVLDSVSRPDVR